jgi:1-acyl-sn-glycerol-3-phosphate acyltransferase
MRRPEQTLRFALKTYAFLSHRTCEVTRQEQLPPGPKIIAMNHTVGHDPFHLPFALGEQPYFLLQDGLFALPLVGKLLKETGQIPVYRDTDRAKEAIEQACCYLQQGRTIAIFPEGKEVAAGERIRAKTGVVRMSLESGVPIIPTGLYVPPETLTPLNFHWKGSKRCGAWQFTGKSYMRFGQAWHPDPETSIHAQTDELMDRIYSLVDESRREAACASRFLLNPILQW